MYMMKIVRNQILGKLELVYGYVSVETEFSYEMIKRRIYVWCFFWRKVGIIYI